MTSNEPPTVGELSAAIQSSSNMGTIGGKIGAEFASLGLLTRAKAREQAAKVL